jgi:hypothetical protein
MRGTSARPGSATMLAQSVLAWLFLRAEVRAAGSGW